VEQGRFVIETPYIQRLQRRHFFLFDVVPLIIVLASPLFWRYLYTGWFEMALLFVFWFVTGIGITVGYHRLFTHKAFQTSKSVQIALATFGSMAAQGGVTSWVAIHRLHHERSDTEADLHSPNMHGSGAMNRARGLLHAHFLWMRQHPYPNVVRYAPDILRSPHISAVNRSYFKIVLLGLTLAAVAGYLYHGDIKGVWSALFWGGVVRVFVLGHIIWSINSFLHVFGARDYETKDSSRNVGWLGLLTLGESWHNNHHRFANSPSFGLLWHNLDPGFWVIGTLAKLGLVWDLRLPELAQIEGRRVQHDQTHN
jgi:stearoyl-CoA desaturase (delta-9 desaturase)